MPSAPYSSLRLVSNFPFFWRCLINNRFACITTIPEPFTSINNDGMIFYYIQINTCLRNETKGLLRGRHVSPRRTLDESARLSFLLIPSFAQTLVQIWHLNNSLRHHNAWVNTLLRLTSQYMITSSYRTKANVSLFWGVWIFVMLRAQCVGLCKLSLLGSSERFYFLFFYFLFFFPPISLSAFLALFR